MKINLKALQTYVGFGLSFIPFSFGADVSLKSGDKKCTITEAVTNFKGRGLQVESCGLQCDNVSQCKDLIFIHDPTNKTDVCKIKGTLHVINADKVTICSESGIEVTGSIKGPDKVIFSALGKGEINVQELQQSYNDSNTVKKLNVVVQNFTKVEKVKDPAAIFETTTQQSKKGKPTTRRGVVMEYHLAKGTFFGKQRAREDVYVTYDSVKNKFRYIKKGNSDFKEPEVIPGILIVPVLAPVAPTVVPKAVVPGTPLNAKALAAVKLKPVQQPPQPAQQPQQAVLVQLPPNPQRSGRPLPPLPVKKQGGNQPQPQPQQLAQPGQQVKPSQPNPQAQPQIAKVQQPQALPQVQQVQPVPVIQQIQVQQVQTPKPQKAVVFPVSQSQQGPDPLDPVQNPQDQKLTQGQPATKAPAPEVESDNPLAKSKPLTGDTSGMNENGVNSRIDREGMPEDGSVEAPVPEGKRDDFGDEGEPTYGTDDITNSYDYDINFYNNGEASEVINSAKDLSGVVTTTSFAEPEYMRSEEQNEGLASHPNRNEKGINISTTTTPITTPEDSANFNDLDYMKEGDFKGKDATVTEIGGLKTSTEPSYDYFGYDAPMEYIPTNESASAPASPEVASVVAPERTPTPEAKEEASVTLSQETKSMPELPSWSSSSNPLLDIEQLTREDIPEEILKEMKSIAENQPSVTDFNA